MSKPGSYVPQYPPSFGDASGLAPAVGKHIATQDFLQPLESRRSKEEVPSSERAAAGAIGVSGSADILQLSVRNNHKNEQPSSSKSSSWAGLGLRYPHPLDINSKSRHCHQNQTPEVLSKRTPSDEEENDSDYHRKKLRKDDSSKNGDVKLTPRSKHSATEQRRRSKINDRFQMLRELLPQGDQKKDKASFLLEVIDYVKALQEKVRKYEAVEEKPFTKGNEIVEYKSLSPLETISGRVPERSATPPPPPSDNSPSQPSSSSQENGRPVVEVSAAYSQRLLETLTSAFNSSGIDLSQAHISVRLELGPTNTPATASSKVPS